MWYCGFIYINALVCVPESTHISAALPPCVYTYTNRFPATGSPCQMLLTKQRGKGTSLPCRNLHALLWHLLEQGASGQQVGTLGLVFFADQGAVQPWESGESGSGGRETSMETLGAAICVVWLLQSLQVIYLRALLTAWKWGMPVCGISKGHEIMVMYP